MLSYFPGVCRERILRRRKLVGTTVGVGRRACWEGFVVMGHRKHSLMLESRCHGWILKVLLINKQKHERDLDATWKHLRVRHSPFIHRCKFNSIFYMIVFGLWRAPEVSQPDTLQLSLCCHICLNRSYGKFINGPGLANCQLFHVHSWMERFFSGLYHTHFFKSQRKHWKRRHRKSRC